MSDKKDKKPRGKVSKFVLGAIIGSAVGSILGATLNPKSGRELRGQIAKNSKKTWSKISQILENEKSRKTIFNFLKKIFWKN